MSIFKSYVGLEKIFNNQNKPNIVDDITKHYVIPASPITQVAYNMLGIENNIASSFKLNPLNPNTNVLNPFGDKQEKDFLDFLKPKPYYNIGIPIWNKGYIQEKQQEIKLDQEQSEQENKYTNNLIKKKR